MDLLRGFDMAWILGLSGVIEAVGQLWPIAPLRWLAQQTHHREWEGFTLEDLIFPLFVFLVGVSIVLALPRVLEREGRKAAIRRIVVRGAVLFALGLFFYGGMMRGFDLVRWGGVLQRIALAYVATALLFVFLRPKALTAVGLALLLAYAALLAYVPIRDFAIDRASLKVSLGEAPPPGLDSAGQAQWWKERAGEIRRRYEATVGTVSGRYEIGRNVTAHLDYTYLPGRKYFGTWDPEGILGTLGAVATCILGVLGGCLLRTADLAGARKAGVLALSGLVLAAVGWTWGLAIPVIKNIWTPTYVLVAGGYSLMLLGLFYWLFDVKGWRWGTGPFRWIGSNAIGLYMIANIVAFDRLAARLVGGEISGFMDRVLGRGGGDLLSAIAAFTLVCLLARFLFRRELFIRA